MAVYTAYYDASGAQHFTKGALAVVGLASYESHWMRFERDWQAVLTKFRVPYFHMKEFAHSTGPYVSWRGKEEMRAAYMAALIAALKRNVSKAFCAGVYMPDFHRVDEEYMLSEAWGNGHPDSGAYAQCAHTCMSLVEDWMETRHPRDPIHHVFERGDSGLGAFLHGMPVVGHEIPPSVSVVPKADKSGKRVRQLEGVDLIAWEFRNLYGMAVPGLPVNIRRSLVELVRHIPHEEGCLDEKSLRQLCRDSEVLIRKAADQ